MVKATSTPQNSIAVVSGGASGMGKAITEQLTTAGKKLNKAEGPMPQEESDAEFSFGKVANQEDISALYAPFSQTYGKPDILVCFPNQGVQGFGVSTTASDVTDTYSSKNTISRHNTVESLGYRAPQQARHLSLNYLTVHPSLQPF
ncbi:SDR family oxidoreductase [Rufibacter latericius]|nr:hypothetical protein [Rufibacter latericius]